MKTSLVLFCTAVYPFVGLAQTPGTLVPTGKLIEPRFQHTATLLPNGTILVAGGRTGPGSRPETIGNAELYNPASGVFGATGDMITGRAGHIAILLGDGRVFIAGGFDGAGVPLATGELYDPARGTFSQVGTRFCESPYQVTTAALLNGGRGSGDVRYRRSGAAVAGPGILIRRRN